MSRNIDEILTAWGVSGELAEATKARAELAALRATITESCALIDTLNTTIAEQARQLEQAYRIAARVAENCAINGDGNDRRYKVAMDISRQLLEIAANAPAPQAQPEQDNERIDRMLDVSGWESDEDGR